MRRTESLRRGRCYSLLLLPGLLLAGLHGTARAPWSVVRAQAPRAGNRLAEESFPLPAALEGVDLLRQTAEEATAKSGSCVVCHQQTHDPHDKATVHLGCVDCHGGD